MRILQSVFLFIFLLLVACAQPLVAAPTLAARSSPPAEPPILFDNPSPHSSSEAAGSPWIRSNPGGGGWFMTIGAGPDGLILAASDLSGFYRSQDLGRTWDVIGAAQGLETTHASAVGFHPIDGNIIFLGTEEGVYRSADRGENVQRVLDDGYITDIKISPADPKIGYAAYHSVWDAADGQVYKTVNGGLTWSRVSQNLPDGLRIIELALDPTDMNTLYLLSGERRFASGPMAAYRSLDGGKHWTRLAANLGEVMDIAVSPDNPSRVYLAVVDDYPDGAGKLYRSENRGDSWSLVTHRWGRIWLKPGEPKLIRLIDPFHQFPWDERNGVWESVDDGKTWTQVSKVEDWDVGWTPVYWAYSTDVWAIGDDLSDPEALHWADSQFIFATDNDGRMFYNNYTEEIAPGRWQSHGVDNVVMFDLAISESEPQHIYLGYFDIGCWHSPDAGASWMNCNDFDSTGDWQGGGGNTTAVLADPARDGVVWTAQSPSWDEPGALLRSHDYGQTWAPASGLPAAPLTGLSLDRTDPTDKRTLFITAQGDVYRSVDDGATWSKVFDCDGCRFTAVDAREGDLVYAGGEAGLWRSEQGGDVGSWIEVGLPEMRGRVSGEVWEWGWEGVFAITPDPHAAGTVYVAVFGQDKGLYRSQNRGQTWEKLWSDDFMRDVAVSPVNPAILIATSSSAFMSGGYDPGSNGVLLSTDRGATWTRQNQGMAWPFANPAAFDPGRPNRVWVGSPGTGFQYRDFQFSIRNFLPLIRSLADSE
ncbi:MAG: hypothetical protein GXP42_12165 [Chloroflexi bacterium]|nr:hypothetical protein [Chloroflexota bacterium]